MRYPVDAANITITEFSDGSRYVSAHILPSTCEVQFPSDEWFTNAVKVEVSAVSPAPGCRGKFKMSFRKLAEVDDEEGGHRLFDADHKVVDRGIC